MSIREYRQTLCRVEADLQDVSYMLDTVTNHKGYCASNRTEFRMFCIRGTGSTGHGYVTIEPSQDLTMRIVKEEHARLTKLRDGLRNVIAAGELAVAEAEKHQKFV